MLTKWLTFTALLVGSVNPQRAAPGRGTLTVAPTCRVKGQPEAELMLNCGDGKNSGVVQYWHTPFGELQTPGFHGKLDPVFLDHNGSLVVPNSSVLHSGLYYCLLQHTQGVTLWPYELHIHHTSQKKQDHRGYKQSSSCAGLRLSSRAGPEEAKQGGISDELFAGAVAGSVLLSFVVGFSTGALTRTHVLRCLQVVTMRLRSSRQQQCQIDTQDHQPDVTMTTTLPMYNNQASEIGRVQDDVSVSCSSPPAKPQRSFRHKQEEQQGPTAYLEGCGCTAEEERRIEEEVPGTSLEQKNKECDREAEEQKIFYLLGGGGGSHLDSEEKGGRGSMEEKQERRQKGEEAGEEERRGSDEEEERGDREKEEDDEEKNREEDVCNDSTETDDNETSRNNQDMMESEAPSSPPRPARRSRVIRLYQYDEEGQRYSHLPDTSPDDPGPAPRLRQRSLSLTRLNAIMAAASAGPLDRRETGKERPHFHMEI